MPKRYQAKHLSSTVPTRPSKPGPSDNMDVDGDATQSYLSGPTPSGEGSVRG